MGKSKRLNKDYTISKDIEAPLNNRELDRKQLSPNPFESVSNDDDSNMHSELRSGELSGSNIVQAELVELIDKVESPNDLRQFSLERTRHLILVLLAGCFVGFINNWIIIGSQWTQSVLVGASGLFVIAYLFVNSEKAKLGGKLLLWSLFLTLSALSIGNDGLRDPSILGFAGLLVLAAMLNERTQYILLSCAVVILVVTLGWVNHISLINYSEAPFGWGTAIDLIIIYFLISYSLWIFSNDLNLVLSRLEIENFKVKESRKQYKRQANYDHLTGLPNRIIAVEHFNHSVSHSHRDNSKVAMLFLDLDNFKTVNDSLGHSLGDLLLKEVARRLLNSVREGDTVCRLGGDEFLIILDDIQDETFVAKIADYILSNVSSLVQIEGHQLTTTCSIGISMSPADGDSFDSLRKKADTAMYRAKNAGRNCFIFYNRLMNEDVLAHIDRVSSLRQAVSNREFILHYQPKVDLFTGRVFSAEALIRWQNPDGKLILPNEFIPIAEKTGLILPIGEWVLYEACRQCKEFQQNGLEDFGIAVNLSSIQFRRGNLETIVNGALASSGLDASYLELEVTESLLIENSTDIKEQINALQQMGVTFSIDDFGTGYSSLSYLKDFDFDFLKIDRSFIKSNRNSDLALCEAIIVMAHKLKLMVIAEGIETPEQRERLVEAGCELGQGELFSGPVAVDEFYRWSESRNRKQQANLASVANIN